MKMNDFFKKTTEKSKKKKNFGKNEPHLKYVYKRINVFVCIIVSKFFKKYNKL